MARVNFTSSSAWIEKHALRAPEAVPNDGQYRFWLTREASVVNGSDEIDSVLCPNFDEVLKQFLDRQSEASTVRSRQTRPVTNVYWGIGVLGFICVSIALALVLCRSFRRRLDHPGIQTTVSFKKRTLNSGQVALLDEAGGGGGDSSSSADDDY